MHDGIHALVFILLCTESSNVFAFHPYELRGTNPAQCVPCNASSYCSAGVRYPCPLNSLAIEYADQLQECICNPGYLGVGEGPPAQIPAELVYDFTSDFNPDPWVWTASYYERVAIWLNYAASIGATTNLNFIGTREGNPDGFGYSALYTTNWTPNGREKEFFELPLPSQYTHMKIIYRINADYGATLGLYINGVLKQTCQDTRNLPPCEYETSYTGSTLLKLLVSQELMVGENLQFFFTQPKPPYSCELGLAPDWYLYGQRNTCPATKGVAANGSGSVEDCVCLPGYASQGPGVYTACLPCPAGTYTKGSNSSECQPCAAGSFQASTGKQVCETCPMNYYSDDVRAIVCTSCPQFSSSARGSQSRASCICNAGYELFNASDGASACRACLPGTYLRNGTCVHCDENTFTDVKASTTCKSCLAQTATYNYPRIGCQCDKGHKCAQQFNFLSVKQVSDGLEDNVNVADHYWNQKFFQLPGVLDTLNLIADNALPERGFEQFNAFSTTYWNVSFPFIKTTDPRTWMRFLDPIKRVTPYHLLPAGTYVGDHPYWGRACHQCESWNYYYGPQDDCYGWESRCGPRVEVPQGLPEAGTCGCGLEWNWKVRTCCEWRPGMHILLDPTDCGPCDTPWNCRCYNGGVQREQGGGNMLPAGDWPSEGVAGKLSQALPFCKYDSDGSILDQFCQTSQTSITVFIFKFYTVLETNSRWIWFVCRKQWTPNFLKCYEFDGNIANVGSYTPAPWNIKRLSAEFSDSCPTACDVCGNNTFKDYTGNLPLGEKDCTKCDVNARSPTGSVLATACLCNSGFHDNGNHTCQACAAGTYKGAGTDHEHDLEPCQQCPVFTSSNERSAKIEDCVCVPGFEGPEFLPAQGGPCVACELGKYKAINGSSSCLNCSIHTWGDETNMTACKSCQDFLRSPGGATESVGAISSDSCFCRPGYITNGTSCSPCAPAHYSLTKNLPECTQCPQHTYTDPALFPWDLTTDCRVCKLCNTLTNTAFTDHYDEARGGVGCGESSVEVCTQCPVRSSLFLQTTDSNRNFGVQSCVCDENSYGIIGSECTLCPVGQNRTGFIYANTTLQNCECLPGYEPDPALPQQCRKCLVDTYKALGGDGNCTSCPAGFVTDGRTAQTYCVCAMGTEQLDTTSEEPVCETCREGRFKNASTDKYANLQCLNCSKICRKCKQKLIDFSPYTVGQGWKDYAVANGFTSSSLFWWATSMHDQSWNAIGNSPGVGYMTYPGLPAEYSTVQVQFAARNIESGQTVYLEIGGSLVATAQNYQTITHKQKYTPGQSLKIVEHGLPGGIAQELKIWLSSCDVVYDSVQSEVELYVIEECHNSSDVICKACQTCQRGSYDNNTCGEKYGNNRLDTQCLPCPDGFYCPGAKSPPFMCTQRVCPANQQVQTLCSGSQDIVCKACQTNSWSNAGRTELGPCLCNAGYELQGELCVACAVGKARQANNSNSIVCETCNSTTFTSVSGTISCRACSPICQDIDTPPPGIFNPPELSRRYSEVSQYHSPGSGNARSMLDSEAGWLNDATYRHMTMDLGKFILVAGVVIQAHKTQNKYVTQVEVQYTDLASPTISCSSQCHVVPSQWIPIKSESGSLRFFPKSTFYNQEKSILLFQTPVITKYIKITVHEQIGGCAMRAGVLIDTMRLFLKHECNASRNVICQDCQKCRPGFYANNTCGANYGNDRLDTECVSCPENYFCPGTPTLQQPLLCSEQLCTANQQVATLCNTTHNITCKACQANSWSYAGRTLLDPCFCNAGYELQGELCVACPVGKARQANANNSIVCETCAVGTFTSVSASITCQFCANDCPDIPFSTHALADFRGIATEVQKNTVGNIPYYDANWNMPGAKKKWADYALSKGVGYFGFTGEGGGGFWGAHLFVEFTLPANYNWFYLTVPHPNVIKVENSAGIGLRVMINDIDVHKCMPPGCDYKRQYTPLQKLKVLATGGVLGYDLVLSVYSSTTGNMATENLYVRQECNASRDVICEKCQTCGPGFYDNNTCGANYGNDRIDTQCVPCQAGSYCPTGTGPPILCPDNGKSPAGSDDLKDCDCDPGYFRDLDGCSLCHFDYYCPGKQIQYSIACPPDSRTARRGSTSRLDCHCHTGYFRDPPESLDSFNCSLCLPGDFCFNNSAYNCSDALMVSAPGSGFFDNCTCDSGYYNNGTVCEDCPINYYCEGGKRFSCLANEWTAYEGRSYECVCMPGFYRDNDVCVPCTDDYFCEGRDDSRQACPQHSTGREASDIQHCLCNSGFEVIANANASEPHTCRACEHTDGAYKYKTGLGNRACSVCTECSPGSHSTWTQIACTPTLNALCDFCTTCHNATENPIRLLYTEQHCQQFFDTRCANCSVCDWDTEWEFSPCSEMDDSQCSPITRDRACPIGFYVGGHTRSSDSQCIPCAVRNTQYEGEWLHHFTSMGRSYGDPYSCDLTCRAFSRLTNVSDPSHGCSTCETGNVLLKEFTQNPLACEFECLPGYTKHGGDCELQTFYADPLIYWNHSLNVTHVRRQAMSNSSGRSAFQLTVGHTAHGNFAVVVGRSEPTCAGRAAVVLRAHSRTACCFSQLWRISTLNQLGLSSTTREQCSRSNPPWSERVSNTQLVFEVSDARIEELANCSRFEDGLVCELYVSIVDTLLLHHFSVPVRLELRRAAALSAVSTQTYVPLSGLHVEAQLAYVELDGSPIFVVVSDMAPLPGAGETDVVLHSAGLRLVQPPPEANCERYGTRVGSSLASDSLSLHNVSAEAWTLAGTPLRAVTFLRAPQGTQFLKLLYSLRLRERDGTIGTKNMMQVAVWRNLSQVRPVCDLPPPLLTVEDGEVFSCSGLGKTTVFAATALHRPTETVRGEVGGLTSFVARALHPHIASIAIKQMLVAFALPAAAERVTAVNVTSMHLGNLAFTDEFKTACQATELCHFRHVHQGRGMHLLNNCNATARESARAWLRINLGFVEDDGHVEALCGLAHRQSARKYAFLVVLVNTRAYLPRGALWHDLQNHSAPQSTSRVAALFEFL